MADATTRTLSLELTRVFDAPRTRVFAAWTKAEALKQWFAPGDSHVERVEVDLRVGGAYLIHIRARDGKDWLASGHYREIRSPERLVFTLRWAHEPDIADMVVTIQFRDRGERTELVLSQENIPNETSRTTHEYGWIGCFDKLPSAMC
jgi:uncharacterized protein YndB with AHSA1/START domain